MEDKQIKNMIEHLVISGGGVTGFSFYGVLRKSHETGFWNIKNIKSIYGTSVGAIIATMITLLPYFDWKMMDDYLIKRPWHQLFHFHLDGMLHSIQNKGIFDKTVIEKFCLPFFEALSYKTEMTVDVNITLAQWYELTNIDLYFVATELSQFKLEIFSHKTHPTWKLVDAMYCTASLPVLFQPLVLENKIYMDGGLLNNFPAQLCIQNGADPDSILGITMVYDDSAVVTPNSIQTLFDYILFILKQVLANIIHKPPQIKHQINVVSSPISFINIYRGAHSEDERRNMVQHGETSWLKYIELQNNIEI